MSYYDYKVIPAPKRAKKVKGISGSADLFALTLTEAINEVSRQGWEYYCSESLSISTPGGWFRPSVTEEQTVLVFRKPREHLSPRLAAAPIEAAEPRTRGAETPRPGVMRREPDFGGSDFGGSGPEEEPGPRATPRLGPAEKV